MIHHVPGMPGHDVWIPCDDCGRLFLGQPFDLVCEWCAADGERIDARDIQRLLFPEFMGWGLVYDHLSYELQSVWASTRGLNGYFIDAWVNRIADAVESGRITEHQADQAVGRFDTWEQIHMQFSERELPNGMQRIP